MTEGTPTDRAAAHAADQAADHAASRRTVLRCAGLVGAGGAAILLTACSTAAVPYDANDAGQAPAPDLAATSSPSAAAANSPAPADGTASPPPRGAPQLARGSRRHGKRRRQPDKRRRIGNAARPDLGHPRGRRDGLHG